MKEYPITTEQKTIAQKYLKRYLFTTENFAINKVVWIAIDRYGVANEQSIQSIVKEWNRQAQQSAWNN